MSRLILFIMAALLAATSVGAQEPSPDGVWLHANKRIQVEVAPCGDRLCGKLVWFKWPNDLQGAPLVDFKNPTSALRTRPLLGLIILTGLRRVGERTWIDGKIHNPDDGGSYSAEMSMQGDGSLSVRAYVLFPLLGDTLIWTRVR